MKHYTLITNLILAGLLLDVGDAHAADVQPRTLRFGYTVTAEHPIGDGVRKFIALIDANSKGKIQIREYPSAALGSDTQQVASLRGGVQDLTAISSSPLVGLVESLALFDLPFLFASEDEADAILDGPIGRRLLDQLADKGLVGLCYFENGFRNLTNSKRPIQKLEDLAGLKLRTQQSAVYLETFSTLGANTIPMAFPEVYSALESRAIDAQENPYANIYQSRFYEVNKYLTATRHAYNPLPVMVSKKLWDDLTPDERALFHAACDEAKIYQRAVTRAQNAKLLALLQEEGMVYNELAEAEIGRMRTRLQPVVEKYTERIGAALVHQVTDALVRLRAAKP